MDEDSSDTDGNPLLALVELRRQAERLALSRAVENPDFQQLLGRKEQEVAIAKSALADLKDKIRVDGEQSQHTISMLQSSLEAKERELQKAKKDYAALTEENKKLADELAKCHKALSDVASERHELNRRHAQELADTRLKYEQEMYILKKLSR